LCEGVRDESNSMTESLLSVHKQSIHLDVNISPININTNTDGQGLNPSGWRVLSFIPIQDIRCFKFLQCHHLICTTWRPDGNFIGKSTTRTRCGYCAEGGRREALDNDARPEARLPPRAYICNCTPSPRALSCFDQHYHPASKPYHQTNMFPY